MLTRSGILNQWWAYRISSQGSTAFLFSFHSFSVSFKELFFLYFPNSIFQGVIHQILLFSSYVYLILFSYQPLTFLCHSYFSLCSFSILLFLSFNSAISIFLSSLLFLLFFIGTLIKIILWKRNGLTNRCNAVIVKLMKDSLWEVHPRNYFEEVRSLAQASWDLFWKFTIFNSWFCRSSRNPFVLA